MLSVKQSKLKYATISIECCALVDGFSGSACEIHRQSFTQFISACLGIAVKLKFFRLKIAFSFRNFPIFSFCEKERKKQRKTGRPQANLFSGERCDFERWMNSFRGALLLSACVATETVFWNVIVCRKRCILNSGPSFKLASSVKIRDLRLDLSKQRQPKRGSIQNPLSRAHH